MRNFIRYVFRTPGWFADQDTAHAISLGHVMVPVYAKAQVDPAPSAGEVPDVACDEGASMTTAKKAV